MCLLRSRGKGKEGSLGILMMMMACDTGVKSSQIRVCLKGIEANGDDDDGVRW